MAGLLFQAELNGLVNSEALDLVGTGGIDLQTGLTHGTYQLRRMPDRLSPLVLSACLITGYPNASVSPDHSPNIFRARPYRYRRELRFRDGGSLVLAATCSLADTVMISQFRLDGELHHPELRNVEPLIESWEPHGPGRVRGHFAISWRTRSGVFVTADAFTDYEVDTEEEQADILHRMVTIDSRIEGHTLRKEQYSVLFRRLPAWARTPSRHS